MSGNRKQTLLKDSELDLLGDKEVESFTGSQADLEGAADCLFASPPHPQPLGLESLSLKTPAKTVPPTPGTALQQKKSSLNLRNPWVLKLTSNYNNKWGCSRLLC